MSATNFKTTNETFRKLLGNGMTYRIPPFQRDYSWGEDEWEDLWQDILGTIRPGGEPGHYMGYLVLQAEDEKNFEVIDGQQRLTTVSLIVLAVLKNLQRLVDKGVDADRNKTRESQIRQTYVGYLDPVTLVTRSKLTLNRNNDHYFQSYIVPLGVLPQRGFRTSEHLLRKAFEWFDRKVREQSGTGGGEEGVMLARLVEDLSDKLFFTVITVTDELNAYKVFETLNARGVRLSATDLLKNYLFSVLHREGQHDAEMRQLESRWESLVGRLGSENFTDFLRAHWNSRRSFVRQTELFKTIRGQVGSREDVFALLRELEEDMDAYLGVTSPEVSGWGADLRELALKLKMFNVRQPFPLLMAAHRTFGANDFRELLRACVVISFRYNVIGNLPTSEQERVYSRVAVGIARGTIVDLRHALSQMTSIYPSDDSFRAAFADKVIRTTQTRNRKVVRYILCELERQVGGVALDFNSDAFNIEHVLPENPDVGWDCFDDEQVESMRYRLGNVTLMESARNRAVGNADYASKLNDYSQSIYRLTSKLAEDAKTWDPQKLLARQRWQADQATAIWRIGQLGG